MTDSATAKNRRNLVMLFVIGLVPVFVAFAVYLYFPQLLPTTTTNQGQLISPPISNEAIGLELSESKWAILVTVYYVCDAGCEQRLYLSRQVNIALGKESGRVKRVLIISENTESTTIHELTEKFQGMQLVQLNRSALDKAFKDVVEEIDSLVFLMDPNGNIMMFYTFEKAGKPMLMDLKHLLKISNIG